MIVTDSQIKKMNIRDSSDNEQYGLSAQADTGTIFNTFDSSKTSIYTTAAIRAYNGGGTEVNLVNETGHTSGKGLQVFNSIDGVKQYALSNQAKAQKMGSLISFDTATE